MVVSCEIALLTPWWTKDKQKLFALTWLFLKFHQQVELLFKTYQAIIVLSFFFENLQTILYWVEAGAGFWSGGASANVLEECDGEERVNCLFSFLLDGFVVTVYTCDVLGCSGWSLMNLQAFGPASD